MKFSSPFSFLSLIFSAGSTGSYNPNGNINRDPYFITTALVIVKKITVPIGTELIYEKQFFKEGKQSKMMRESNLKGIVLPDGETIDWGGVRVNSFKFFNTGMRGFTVNADFNKNNTKTATRFSKLWQDCDNKLGVSIKDATDWSFNPNNIADVESCGVIYQRDFKKDKEKQAYLDALFSELKKAELK